MPQNKIDLSGPEMAKRASADIRAAYDKVRKNGGSAKEAQAQADAWANRYRRAGYSVPKSDFGGLGYQDPPTNANQTQDAISQIKAIRDKAVKAGNSTKAIQAEVDAAVRRYQRAGYKVDASQIGKTAGKVAPAVINPMYGVAAGMAAADQATDFERTKYSGNFGGPSFNQNPYAKSAYSGQSTLSKNMGVGKK